MKPQTTKMRMRKLIKLDDVGASKVICKRITRSTIKSGPLHTLQDFGEYHLLEDSNCNAEVWGKQVTDKKGILLADIKEIKFWDTVFRGCLFTATASLKLTIRIRINCESRLEEELTLGWVDVLKGTVNRIGSQKVHNLTSVDVANTMVISTGMKFFIVLIQADINSSIHVLPYFNSNGHYEPRWLNVIDLIGD